MRLPLVVLAVLVLRSGAPAAHHWASASFDAARPFTLTGLVTKVVWTNPHVALYLEVRDERTSAPVSWMMDMGSPSTLARLGWSKTSVKAGDAIVVDGIPSRDGTRVGYAYAVTMAATGRRLPASPVRER